MDQKILDQFNDSKVLLIFSYAPAGLGHLRVTNALSHGLPHGGSKILMGSRDQNVTFLHRLTSIHPLGRKLMEWFQYGRQEKIFTHFYRNLLRFQTKHVYHQLLTLIDSRVERPKRVIIIATHFLLAHQIAQVKDKLEDEKKVKVYLIVQVTDDSPQAVWYVNGADIIFVPSRYTRDVLTEYGKNAGLPQVQITVNPYPVSPMLGENIYNDKFRQRISQLDFQDSVKTEICLPVSGAAVGLEFYANIIKNLHEKSEKYKFHVISKKVPFTMGFLESLKNLSYVKVYSSSSDREVVSEYDKIYKENVISLEITKPSEQAFKALLNPWQLGGSVLLFTEPVGRQEYDNLHFLSKHGLIPRSVDNEKIWSAVKTGQDKENILYNLRSYRGFRLPQGSQECAEFIHNCLKKKIFYDMTVSDKSKELTEAEMEEMGADGVARVWKNVAEFCFRSWDAY